MSKYDQKVVLEALHNCIAHQDYRQNQRIIVTERPDRLVFEYAGHFYEGAPEDYVRGDKTPRGYRNPYLVQAMVELNMIDQMSYGMQKEAAITLNQDTGAYQTASWYGLSALAAYKFTPRLEGIARFDYINNGKNGGGLLGYGADGVNGIGPDATLDCGTAYVSGCENGANRYALSLGVNYLFNEYTMFKAEYRYDWSNLNVFEWVDDGAYRKYNNVFGASVVVFF